MTFISFKLALYNTNISSLQHRSMIPLCKLRRRRNRMHKRVNKLASTAPSKEDHLTVCIDMLRPNGEFTFSGSSQELSDLILAAVKPIFKQYHLDHPKQADEPPAPPPQPPSPFASLSKENTYLPHLSAYVTLNKEPTDGHKFAGKLTSRDRQTLITRFLFGFADEAPSTAVRKRVRMAQHQPLFWWPNDVPFVRPSDKDLQTGKLLKLNL